jgi:16S rRNA (guanine527-N7)-methyltransferase
VTGRLAELAREHGLSEEARGRLQALLELLAADPEAPTSVREAERAVDVHVADALTGLALEPVRTARVLADIGAGAGVPGLVLAAARPELRVIEVESLGRKCAFLRRAIAAMGLRNAEVACVRAEQWPEGVGRCDVVTARAVAPLNTLVEYAAPLLRPAGALVAWKGAVSDEEAADGEAAAALLGLAPAEVVRVEPFVGAEQHRLSFYRWVGSVPKGFPRRPGTARKRPIRASTRG